MKKCELITKKFDNSKLNVTFVELLSFSCFAKYPKILLSEPLQAQNFTIKTGKKMTNFTLLRSRIALFLLTIASIGGYQAHAQQEAMYSQYMFNTLLVNPAYAGSRDVLSVTALGRHQWSGVDGAPRTYTLSVDMPFKNEKMGLGLTVFNDRLGVFNTFGSYLSYAYRVKVGNRSTLSFGAQGGLDYINLGLGTVVLPTSDPAFVSGTKSIPNVGGGLYFSNDIGYLGVSVPRILERPLYNTVGDSTGNGKQRRHYNLMMGLVFGKGSFKVKPSTLVRYVNGFGLGIDANINFWIKDKIAFGVSARRNQFKDFGSLNSMDAIIGMLEVQLTPQMKIGYAMDYTTNKLNSAGKFNSDLGPLSHELMLRYEFGFGKNKILTPRYF